MSERITENITKKLFISNGFDENNIEEQKSQNPIIDKLLKWWSKKWTWKSKPEFIIKFKNSDTLIVVECKAFIKNHESETKDKFVDYAVDWVLFYWAKLSKQFNVIAIAVSGQNEKELKISTFLFLKWEQTYKNLELNKILSEKEYENIILKDPEVEKKAKADLLKFSRELHNNIRDYAKLSESEKPLFVSGILIALKDKEFKNSYEYAWNLQKSLFQAIVRQIDAFDIPWEKKELMKDTYKFLEKHPNLKKNYKKSSETVLKILIDQIAQNIVPFFDSYDEYDIIWSFYWEFLRYTGWDKQWLWIVLTPKHITELFVELARVNIDSKVLDPCAWTWWFLISAMKKMINDASWEEKLIERIKKEQLIWIEQNPNMYTLACSNMILRWDWKANIYGWDCFNPKIVKEITTKHKSTIWFINPPYSQKWEWQSEMEFVEHMLDMLEKNWTWIAIVPMSCALTSNKKNNEVKSRILKKHTLRAVFSMPDDLFYPVWTVTCIMVFTANNPHNEYIDTWFWYCKNDWFIKTKTDWRIDKYKKYNSIKEKWLKSFFSQSSIPWLSITKHVEWNDEWCAEAYLETDYSDLNEVDFLTNLKNFLSFSFLSWKLENILSESLIEEKINLKEKEFKFFKIQDLFEVKGTKTTKKEILEEYWKWKYPYVTTQSTNNWVAWFYDFYTEEWWVLTIDSAVVWFCSYQENKFSASDHVEKLIPKFKINKYIALFLTTIINKEQYRYNYWRKFNQWRIKETKVKLPVDEQWNPDWNFMEKYIKSLDYSASL